MRKARENNCESCQVFCNIANEEHPKYLKFLKTVLSAIHNVDSGSEMETM